MKNQGDERFTNWKELVGKKKGTHWQIEMMSESCTMWNVF
jgi:hypothetical protein